MVFCFAFLIKMTEIIPLNFPKKKNALEDLTRMLSSNKHWLAQYDISLEDVNNPFVKERVRGIIYSEYFPKYL
jgi:hypothetical protein